MQKTTTRVLRTGILKKEEKLTKIQPKTIIYHEDLYKISENTLDPFWKTKIENMSRGKFTKNISLNSNTLIYKKGAKIQTLDITINENSDLSNMCKDIIKFIQNNCNMWSSDDAVKQQKKYIKLFREFKPKDILWQNLTKKTKRYIIYLYCQKLVNENIKIAKVYTAYQLLLIIERIFSTKTLLKKNIIYNNLRIEKIEGLEFSNGHLITKIKKPKNKKTIIRKKKENNLMKNWKNIISF